MARYLFLSFSFLFLLFVIFFLSFSLFFFFSFLFSYSYSLSFLIPLKGEFIGSCSSDGRVVISALYTPETTEHNYNRPLISLALDPDYFRKKTNQFCTGGKSGQLSLNSKGILPSFLLFLLCSFVLVWLLMWKNRVVQSEGHDYPFWGGANLQCKVAGPLHRVGQRHGGQDLRHHFSTEDLECNPYQRVSSSRFVQV